MPHIQLPDGLPGIVGPMVAYPESGQALNNLAEVLLRGPSPLTPGEREMIAAYVSAGNACTFCSNVHAAVAREHLAEQSALMDEVLASGDGRSVSPKLKALLAIADKVRQDGRLVSDADVAEARAQGADDRAIHDTVLIAAAFCMFNRYVDGLATALPADPAHYRETGKRLAERGYARALD